MLFNAFDAFKYIVMHCNVDKKKEMNRALGHLCAHIGQTGPGEPFEDGEMIEMTLSSRHRIRNSSPGWGRNNFVSFKPPRPGTEPRTLA